MIIFLHVSSVMRHHQWQRLFFFFFFLLLIALFVVFAPLFVSLLRRCLPFNCTYIYEHKRVHVPVIGPAFTAAQTLDKVPCCAPVETPAGKRGSSAVTPNFHMWGKGLKAGVWAWLGGCLFFFFFRGTLEGKGIPARTQSAEGEVGLHVHVCKARSPCPVAGEFGVLQAPPGSFVLSVEYRRAGGREQK